MNKLLLIPLLIFVAACDPELKTRQTPNVEYQEVYKPVVYCPVPPEISETTLEYKSLTQEEIQDDGTLVKTILIDFRELQGKNDIYKLIVDKYRELGEKPENIDILTSEDRERLEEIQEDFKDLEQ